MYYNLLSSMSSGIIAPSYTARTTAFASATGITDLTILNALNTFDLGLISNGLDSKFYYLYPFVGSTNTEMKFNFINTSTFQATFNGGITFGTNQLNANGTNGYIDTSFNPSINAILNDDCFGFFNSTSGTQASAEMGVLNISLRGNNFSSNYPAVGRITSLNGDYTTSSVLATTELGLNLITRDSSTVKVYTSAVERNSFTSSNDVLVNLNEFICARNNNGSPGLYSSRVFKLAFHSKHLNPSEIITLNTLVTNLNTSLSR